MAPQSCGTLGQVGNCQLGVFLAYAGARGHTLLDRALYLPAAWTDAGARPRRRPALPVAPGLKSTPPCHRPPLPGAPGPGAASRPQTGAGPPRKALQGPLDPGPG